MSPFIAGCQEGPGVPGEGAVSFTIWKESIWGEYSHFFPFLSEIHNIKFTILAIFKVPFSCVKYIYIIVQQTSGTFSSCETETLYSLNMNSPSSLPPAPGNHLSTFYIYDLDNFRYFSGMEPCSICPFVTGWFHLAWCPRGSKHINVLTACVYSHGLAECQLCPAPTSSLSPVVHKFWKLLLCVCVRARALYRVWCFINPILHPQIPIIVPSPVSSGRLLECQNLSTLARFLVQGFVYLTPVCLFFPLSSSFPTIS